MGPAWEWVRTGAVAALRCRHLEQAGGVQALFTARHAGVSRPPWDTLNLSYSVGDQPEAVAENRRRALAAAGADPERAVMAGLVHGCDAARVDGPAPPGPGRAAGDPTGLVPGVDILVSATAGLALMVTTADCVPVWLLDPDRRAVGLVHAGWRGTALGAVRHAVARMQAEFGSDPARLLAAVGPAIGPCCYEVDEPVRAAFAGAAAAPAGHAATAPQDAASPERAANGWFRPGRGPGRWLLDLPAANRDQLAAAGLAPGSVAVAGICTACHTDRFFSHRGEAGRTGRQAAIIVLER